MLVSTQSLEVGVDLDLAAMVTELASGSALAQRAGRVNRRGLRESGSVVVTIPQSAVCDAAVEDVLSERTRSGPYGAEELRAALTWLRGRAADSFGLAPWSLRSRPPPSAARGRELFQRPELADVWHWARTSDDLAAEPELDLWLAEDFDEQTSVGFVIRDGMPVDAAEALRLVRTLPPRRHETFPVPYRTAVSALRTRGAATDAPDERATDPVMIRVRGEDIGLLDWRPARSGMSGEEPRLRPGDIVVLDSSLELFTTSVEGAGFSPPVVVPVGDDGTPPSRAVADDVLEAEADLPAPVWAARRVGGVVLRLDARQGADDFDALSAAVTPTDETLSDDGLRTVVRDWLDLRRRGRADAGMAAAAAELLAEPSNRSEVVVHRDVDEQLVRVVVIDRRRASADEGIRQVWTPAGGNVALDTHQRAVAERAVLLGHELGLTDGMVENLRLAGAHHDDGKADSRFQVRLGARGGVVLAKSRAGTTAAQAKRNNQLSGLGQWRHEQRSVVQCWGVIHSAVGQDPSLIARLVGTTHGHGRSGFPHTSDELLLPDDVAELRAAAVDLFDIGGWDSLIEATQQRYGVWGCAYLESILRAADGQVSEEGM